MSRILEDVRDPSINEVIEDLVIDTQIRLPNSVVGKKYKIRYKARAKERGDKSRIAKRSVWDWTAQVMATETLNKAGKTDVERLYQFLAANGIDADQWPSRTPGWEGRLRMTGGLVLRRQLAETGICHTADGEELEVPEEEMARLRVKFDI